jgi:hypothetical protein
LALSQNEEETSSDPWDKFLVSEVSCYYYAVAEGRNSGSFVIYADVGKFTSEVDGGVGALFKVCPTLPEARLYLEVHQGRGQRDPPVPKRDPDRTSMGRGRTTTLQVPSEGERNDLFREIMLNLGGRSVSGDQSKGKEGKLFGLSVLDTFKLRNGPVPDPERLPGVFKKHCTEQRTDFVACPWSEGQGGYLDGDHSDLLTHALTTLVGKKNDETFGNHYGYPVTKSEEDYSWACTKP